MRWIASTRVALSVTSVACRAAVVPILILSWLWASLDRENTIAGAAACKASAVIAEQEIWAALKPW